jgi:Smg protein
MKPNVLDMLIDFLDDFDNGIERLPFDAHTLQKLEKLGFDQETIEEAYAWFHESAHYEEMEVVNEPSPMAMRAYNAQEMEFLSASCRGLIMKLDQMGVLTAGTREMIISHMLQLDIREMDVEQLKWLSIITLTDHLDDATITQVLNYLLLQTEEA